MTDQRGLSLVELLVAAALTTVVAGGLFSAYMATRAPSASPAHRRRSSARARWSWMRSVARCAAPSSRSRDLRGERRLYRARARRASVISHHRDVQWRPGFTAGENSGGESLLLRRADGALCEARGITCHNLLAGGLKTIALLRQPAVPDPRCPPGVPAGAPCFRMALVPNAVGPATQVELAFAIRDNDGDLDGVNVMAFSISLTCSGRNC